ncbi:hypothetical protein AX15_002709 [Amanita polypyramis BW_CC]|nr:hypothetical protein AX15_002709 [Amanita polypyramis BW_CC]
MKLEDETTEQISKEYEDNASVAEESEEEEEEEEVTDREDTSCSRSPRASPSQMGVGYRKLATVVAVFAILLGFVLSTYQATQTQKPKVVHANRYSKEHKFRPAASPIITETLKDGRVRVRGAEPTMSIPPKPKPTTAKRKRKARSKTRNKKTKTLRK